MITEQGVCLEGIIYSSLSQLREGDVFSFKDGQKVLYNTDHNRYSYLETKEHQQYTVLKKNKKTIKIAFRGGSVVFHVNFAGVFADYTRGNNCQVFLKSKDHHEQVWDYFINEKAKQYGITLQ